MPLIHEIRFAGIDFESAGARKGETDCPIQIGMGTWKPEEKVKDLFVSYLKSEKEVMWQSQRIHHISNKDLVHAPSFLSLWPEVKSRLSNSAIVAHGYGTEKRYLRTFPNHGFSPWIDTLTLSRAAYPNLTNHKLGTVCDELELTGLIDKIVPERQWHDALYDAVGSLVILSKVIQDFTLMEASLEVLVQPKKFF